MSKTFWVLPDINQNGKLWVVNSLTNEKMSLIDFYKKFNVKEVAKEFEVGIPEELLDKFKSPQFGFSQIIKNKFDNIFSLSIRCGKDIEERTVTLTYIQVLSDLKEISLPSQDDLEFLKNVNPKFNFQVGQDVVSKIERIKKAAFRFPDIISFSSEKLERNIYKHGWNGEDPSSKKFIMIGLGIALLIFLIILIK
ncbi:hypothetical protein [Acinetobacter sp. SwsAc4]|uniref:hypothetical protein n=1 Tax=Acinetobacter sp. SwsAc4 TaxID=2749437 RepID=UPI0015C03814|nr:hypothetical protein [Acinetobacter sp. SwsAc4]NWK82102.1 hypothetical protein [Acinetobacter sp. SwsAc4]